MSLHRFSVALLALLFCPALRAGGGVAKLQRRVEQLEQLVTTLEQRLDALEATRSAPPVLTTAALQAPKPEAPQPAPTAPPQSGPIKFGGDFRLYFDSITRPAGGGAKRVSNIRGRYLLHLDFEAALRKTLSFHGQLSTSPLTNPLTDIQDFSGGVAKHPFFLSKAYIDYHPNEFVRLQGGRVDSPFSDRSRFLFDQDTRFNGTSEMFRLPLHKAPAGITEIQFLAGQYTFSNPSFPIIEPGTPSTAAGATPSQAFLAAGAEAGTQPRASQLFQQGFVIRQKLGASITSDVAADVQLYRNPNQLRLMSTPGGLFLIGGAIGITPSGPVPSASNATTTPGGATLTPDAFRIGHTAWTLSDRSANIFGRSVPVSLNLHWARNFQPVSNRDAWAAILSAGRTSEAGDIRLQYGYYHKEANSMIGELTENDLAIGGNVNMRAHIVRLDYTLGRGITWVNNLIWTRWLADSSPQANFFVPLGRSVPGQIRYQSILMFRF
jgi:hypothetical protein